MAILSFQGHREHVQLLPRDLRKRAYKVGIYESSICIECAEEMVKDR